MNHNMCRFLYQLILLQLPSLVFAHRPLLNRPSCDSDYGSSFTAAPIPDPSISWAFSHYADCTNRALWTSFTNPSQDFVFNVGVDVPPVDRFVDVRANALIIGLGLPPLTEEEVASLPEEVRNDPIWEANPDYGAYYHKSPQDQSTCDHLGTVMKGVSTIRNERCDFYEPFGQTHSWRVLDADVNVIPVENATYYVTVFLQDHTSAKFGVALGTWVENFITRYNLDTPTSSRDIDDFLEKGGLQEDCFPMSMCSALKDDEVVGCPGPVEADVVEEKICELGQVCPNFLAPELCVVSGIKYETPTMGACGG